MPYTAAHRIQTKKNIVDSARRLFNRHGFENVSIGQIMAGAGLTHGGFYSYFDSKSDLYAEVLNCFFTDPEWKNCWEGVYVDLSSTDVGAQVVRAYLSRQHYEDVENSCPMVAFAYRCRSEWNCSKAGIRDRVSGDGQRVGAELEGQEAALPGDRTSDRCAQHRRNGCGEDVSRP